MANKSDTPKTGHWLFTDYREHKIDHETDCRKCIHRKVCSKVMEDRCSNYKFGTSAETGCHSCLNRFARFDDKQPIPCFICPDFLDEKWVKIEPK